ncbi:MAG: HAD family hydrolase [bacterium]
MKKTIRLFPFMMLGILYLSAFLFPLTGYAGGDPLDRLNWSERNHRILSGMIADYGVGGKYYDINQTPYIVLDWDQTCAYLDVEEALMRYQLFNLRFKMNTEQFSNILKDNINGIESLSIENRNIRLIDINTDLVNDYRFLMKNYSGSGGKMTLEEIKKRPEFLDFVSKMIFLADGYYSTPGIGMEYTFIWEISLLSGFTTDEVRDMAKEAINFELGNRIGKETIVSPAEYQTRAGVISCSFYTGLRVLPEMQDFISTCQGHGIEVYIVSASYKPVVEVFAGAGNFGYNLPPDHVIAMEFETSADGKILPQYKSGWYKTVKQGKVEAINKVIKSLPGKNHDPLLAGGDSDGDYEMLTRFPGMKFSLIWNRVKGGEIGKLCRQAVEQSDLPKPRFLLQGRNENTGLTIPTSETIGFGKDKPQLMVQ